MANINELEWAKVKGSKYPVAKTTIGETEINIIKLDEDSYKVTIGESEEEINLSQLETIIETGELTNGIESDEEYVDEEYVDEEKTKSIELISNWSSDSLWKDVDGKKVLEVAHQYHEDENGILRIIKLDDDSYQLAVILNNDESNIDYVDLNRKYTIINYASALGISPGAAELHYDNMSKQSETTDYETVEE